MTARAPERCDYREILSASTPCPIRCRFLTQWLREPQNLERRVCVECCQYPLPDRSHINPVIASFIYQALSRRLRQISRTDPRRVCLEGQLAWSERRLMVESADGARWVGVSNLLDRSVNADRIRHLIDARQPFVLARYGDGEWLSIWGESGRTSDGHDLMPQTLGKELLDSLHYWGSLEGRSGIYVGTIERWREREMVQFLARKGLLESIRWVSALLLLEGLGNLSSKALFEAIRNCSGRKLLVGNATLAPVAKSLGLTHIEVPLRNCYAEIDSIEESCRFAGPGLIVFCAGMATECLIMRLHRQNPVVMYLDAGHIFDAIVGRRTRRYTQQDTDGLFSIIEKHYQSMVNWRQPCTDRARTAPPDRR